MTDYKSNSFKNREPNTKKPADETNRKNKVISGKATISKKSIAKKATESIIQNEMSKIKEYAIFDVLIPSVKKAIGDIIKNGCDMMLFGEIRSNRSSFGRREEPYSRYYREREHERGGSGRRRESSSQRYNFENLTFENRLDAEEVLANMEDTLEEFGMVRVADLYDFAGITGEHTDNKYGWTDLRTADVIRLPEGYYIKLPRVTILR